MFLLATIANTGWLIVPWGYKTLIDAVSTGALVEKTMWLGVYLIVAGELITFVFFRLAEIVSVFAETKTIAHLNNLCYRKIINQSHTFFEKQHSGTIVRRVNQYLDAFVSLYEQLLWNFLGNLVLILGSIIILGKQNIYWAIALIVWALIYITFVWVATTYKQRYDLKVAKIDRRVAEQLSDTVTNSLTVRTSGAIGREISRYRGLTKKHAQNQRKSWSYDVIFEAIQGMFMFSLEFVMIYLTIRHWQTGTIVVSDLVLLQGFLLPIMVHFWSVARLIRRSYEALANAQSMTKTFIQPNEILDYPGATNLKLTAGLVDFRNVNFAYHQDKPVLHNFTWQIKGGEKVALVGPSGGGKSTITKLLLRLHDAQTGEISVDGQNIKDVTQQSLQKNISYVPQEPLLFHRSILENIRYAKPSASIAEVKEASKRARAHEFITNFPQRYSAVVGERGTRLSGGERQRIILARAFLQDSKIIIMDEPTSSLDSISEKAIQVALKELFLDRTVIVVAHRLATIREMDRICVIKNGRLIEQGTHASLNELEKGTYQKLWEIQGSVS